MEHPPGLVKKKLHVIYLKSLGFPYHQIALIARVSGDAVTSYLKEYSPKVAWQPLAWCASIAQPVPCCRIKNR